MVRSMWRGMVFRKPRATTLMVRRPSRGSGAGLVLPGRTIPKVILVVLRLLWTSFQLSPRINLGKNLALQAISCPLQAPGTTSTASGAQLQVIPGSRQAKPRSRLQPTTSNLSSRVSKTKHQATSPSASRGERKKTRSARRRIKPPSKSQHSYFDFQRSQRKRCLYITCFCFSRDTPPVHSTGPLQLHINTEHPTTSPTSA